VAGVLAHHAVAEALGVGLDDASDDVGLAARPDRADTAQHRLLGALHQEPGILVEFATAEGCAVVAVDAVLERGHVDLDQVAVLERPGVGDAVTDDLVDRGADRLGEAR
jgi:hypothetical protein